MLSNFSLGKYDIKSFDDEKFLVSSVFPNHPSLGRISYGKFNFLLQKTYGDELGVAVRDAGVYLPKLQESSTSRSPSSEDVEEEGVPAEDDGPLYVLWPVVILGLLGAFGTWSKSWKR